MSGSGTPGTGTPGTGTPGTGHRPPLRVVVADDQASVREGLVLLLGLLPDIEVVGSASNGLLALEQVAEHRPDAILLDLHMPVLDGIEATKRLTAEHPEVAIVVLTTYADDSSILDTLRAGARAYLTKDADRHHIAQTLHSAASGLTVLDPQVQAALLNAARNGPAGYAPDPAASAASSAAPSATVPQAAPQQELPDGLTPREAEVLTLLARGMTNTEISATLFLSGNTVKTHINRVFAKTGSRDRVAASHYAHRHHLD